MFEPDPLDRDRLEQSLRLNRRSRAEALRVNILERARLQRELEDLDDAIAGVNHMQMAELRAWAERLDRERALRDAESAERDRDEALEETFPASDPPAYTAPGSMAGR